MHPMRNTYLGALRLIARAEDSFTDELNAMNAGDGAAARRHGRAGVRRQKAARRLLDSLERSFAAEAQR